MDLVDDDDLAVLRLAELVLRVHQDEPALRAELLAGGEERQCDLGGSIELSRGDAAHRDDLLARGRHVVLALRRLRGRREERALEALVLLQPLGELVTAEDALAGLVVRPHARRGRARDVRTNDHLDGQRRAVDALEDVRIRHADEVVLRHVLRLLEPPRRETVQHLPLERDRAQDAIERTDAIADDDETPAVTAVVVADLALVALPEPFEPRGLESVREVLLQQRFVDQRRHEPRLVDAGAAVDGEEPSTARLVHGSSCGA